MGRTDAGVNVQLPAMNVYSQRGARSAVFRDIDLPGGERSRGELAKGRNVHKSLRL